MSAGLARSGLTLPPPQADKRIAAKSSAAHAIRLLFNIDIRRNLRKGWSDGNGKPTTGEPRRHSAVAGDSGVRQRNAALAHVFAAAILVADLAILVGFEKQHLRHAFIGVDARRQRR